MKSTDDIDANVLQSARDWLLRLSSEDVAASDLVALKVWLAADSTHRRAFERERGFWQDLEPHRALFERPSSRFIAPRRGHRRWLRRPSRTAWASVSAIAASLALFLAVPTLSLRFQADHIAEAGQITTISLPDQSTAMLDSGSAIAVRYSGAERRIEVLQGRAWFDVRHGDARPFRVAAGDGQAEDIGTAFEVAYDDAQVEVSVSQGAVRASADRANMLVLHAGERARYGASRIERLPAVAPDRIAAWRSGELLIDDMPLAEAIRQVARYRRGGTYLWSDAATAKRVSGVFRIDRPDDALAALAGNAGLRLTRLPGGIIILR